MDLKEAILKVITKDHSSDAKQLKDDIEEVIKEHSTDAKQLKDDIQKVITEDHSSDAKQLKEAIQKVINEHSSDAKGKWEIKVCMKCLGYSVWVIQLACTKCTRINHLTDRL